MTTTVIQRKLNEEYCRNANSIKAMVDSGLTHIPSDFILPQNMQPRFTKSDKSRDVPTIDLSLVVGHGISATLRKKLIQVIREFFDLPLSDKLQFLGPSGDTSTPRYGRTRRGKTGHQSWRDQFHHRTPPLDFEELQSWPEKPETYRDTILEWTKEIQKVTDTVFSLLADAYDLQPRRLQNLMGTAESGMEATMLAAYYPPCPQPDVASGIVAHTDPVGMVVNFEDVPGLEVQKDGTWILVAPDPESLIILTGDAMEIITNGRCKSCEHRVLLKEKQDRVSALVLMKPSLEAKLCVAPEFITSGPPSRFMGMNMTYREYLQTFRRKCSDATVDS
ncbi:hypothetical protein AXG93_392s1410 [Marchantia polymorpha subsp. ruderalis]|uniref:Fe2OG dioxygenase domain-containing protein n=1 Tax=Marchantia polymorpha subsp. ruderalis TaxID=1480154 RepID=A0A176WSN8_MARPO|nr:hypothetical protein AXG93_392s1410 [Marchantia polymorpha subsp. ruderalis]